MTEPLYLDGALYDRLLVSSAEPPQIWLDFAARYSGPILELASGTGRVSIPLAQSGFDVSGLELAPPMLGAARHKATAAEVGVTWAQGDMRDFDLGRRFSLVILPNNTLCHLYTLADFEACMAAVRRDLRPNGHFIVELFFPNLDILRQAPDERTPFASFSAPDGSGEVIVTQTARYDAATQMRHITLYYQFSNQFASRDEELTGELNMRIYFPLELDALFRYNSFAIQHKYGDFALRPFDANSPTQIFVLAQT